MVTAIVGANWGDEGKGKITDIRAAGSDVAVRFQGGSNAGHTIINEYGKFALHQIPSGIFHAETTNVIGNGCALNIEFLIKEIETVKAAVKDFKLMISDRAQVLCPYHVLLDELEEARLGDRRFGSTKSGIAPFYSDKYAKTGIQVNELYDGALLRQKIEASLEKINATLKALYGAEPLVPSVLYEKLRRLSEEIEKYAADTSAFLRRALRDGKNILLEGQLGALKDTDHGIYPYVTSSSTLAGFAAVGAGIPPYEIKNILTVTKAYSSAVGEGPFVSEIFGAEADELRRRGGDAGEYGATTGRPRRVGWFDIPATKYGAQLQGATELALTGLDVLGYLDEIPVCAAYETDGRVSEDFPNTAALGRAKPVVEKLPGFKADIRGVRRFSDLPREARDYVKFIEERIGVKITMLSNGPKRHEMVEIQA
ncbi:MAG: adenylosuccinate synthase [Clostridiales bacterium]|jgi:adenylosuccinate synthase|nr:adenylosuccinate synthase [Clostridiales bacterium]